MVDAASFSPVPPSPTFLFPCPAVSQQGHATIGRHRTSSLSHLQKPTINSNASTAGQAVGVREDHPSSSTGVIYVGSPTSRDSLRPVGCLLAYEARLTSWVVPKSCNCDVDPCALPLFSQSPKVSLCIIPWVRMLSFSRSRSHIFVPYRSRLTAFPKVVFQQHSSCPVPCLPPRPSPGALEKSPGHGHSQAKQTKSDRPCPLIQTDVARASIYFSTGTAKARPRENHDLITLNWPPSSFLLPLSVSPEPPVATVSSPFQTTSSLFHPAAVPACVRTIETSNQVPRAFSAPPQQCGLYAQ